MPIITARLAMTCGAALLALSLAACGASTTTPSATAPAAPPAPTSSSVTTSATNGGGTNSASAPTPAATKVSANTASENEIATALQNAGVSNPQRWAKEVVEYRPYAPDDPNLTKLRTNLAKYNPGQETTDKIVSALRP
jgi:hypothetical protein